MSGIHFLCSTKCKEKKLYEIKLDHHKEDKLTKKSLKSSNETFKDCLMQKHF